MWGYHAMVHSGAGLGSAHLRGWRSGKLPGRVPGSG